MSLPVIEWPYLFTFKRLTLALAVGLFVGIERERRGKEAGLCTFGIASLMGCIGGLLGDAYAILSILLSIVLIVLLNIQALKDKESIQINTSAALLIISFAGVLCGQGHTLTPAAIAVITTALLAWKRPLVGFSLGLTDAEIRSAVLLAILAFVIYPALPEGSIDRWGAFEPRSAWITVVLIAGIGFINYTLLKIYGERGIELTGFLGGLVNSSVTVSELSARVRESQGKLIDVAYRGILLATGAMILRNVIIIALLAPKVLGQSLTPLLLMLLIIVGLVFFKRRPIEEAAAEKTALLTLETPFSLKSALKFGVLFLVLQITGILGQHTLGQIGVYVISLFGGLFSSASSVAASASLAAKGTVSNNVAGTSAVIASLASVLVNLPLVFSAHEKRLTKRLILVLGTIMLLGVIGILIQPYLLAIISVVIDALTYTLK